MKFVWQYTRRRREENRLYKFVWVKGLPFKVSFFMWRLRKTKLPLDDWFLRMGYFRTSRCWYCRNPKKKTLPHVFLKSPVARYVWDYFGAPHVGWIKCNIDGACKGDNRGASYAFCIRDVIGNLIYAQADSIVDAINSIAEAQVILEALRYITQ